MHPKYALTIVERPLSVPREGTFDPSETPSTLTLPSWQLVLEVLVVYLLPALSLVLYWTPFRKASAITLIVSMAVAFFLGIVQLARRSREM